MWLLSKKSVQSTSDAFSAYYSNEKYDTKHCQV